MISHNIFYQVRSFFLLFDGKAALNLFLGDCLCRPFVLIYPTYLRLVLVEIHQEDFCSLVRQVSTRKYYGDCHGLCGEEGSFRSCFAKNKRYCRAGIFYGSLLGDRHQYNRSVQFSGLARKFSVVDNCAAKLFQEVGRNGQ